MPAQAQQGSGLTLTALGCGTMGIAVLSGVMAKLAELESQASASSEDVPKRLPTRFIACVRSEKSAKRIENDLSKHSASLDIMRNDNVKAVEQADIVLLGCKPYMVRDILGVEGMREALKGKLLLSMLAGVTVQQIEETLYGSASTGDPIAEGRCRAVRVMPNYAAFIQESMTVIETSTPPLSDESAALVAWIFNSVGKVVFLPPSGLDASTALAGSGPAFMTVILEAMADGGVAMGLPRAEAQLMAAQVMRGASGLVLNGEHPAVAKDKICSPGGCTIGGLTVLEERGVRGSVSRAVREATVVASQLGQGVRNVNGTRH
ncbi:pyrroline-5-carboxylate reductase [Xylona heveae TC161]|uniref:Pyrroline-5-carboxylate reductase n=1 Tax=Xylona heveae (strain CBS 132557 / TC161) TaxID=1328760 RepID=A0A165G101_XYLHT|nr:pyrroline-5-carboxylate reductase [Xylona heveae TC161]KZF21613.1 pyrroline-5-carboxylate reductase [Xylona heveae TC161]